MDAVFAAGIRSVLDNLKDRFEMEYVCRCPSGKRWFHGQVTPFPCKKSGWAVVACEDITERKTAEQEKARRATQLRHNQIYMREKPNRQRDVIFGWCL